MGSAGSRRWRVSVEGGNALIEEWEPSPFAGGGLWFVRMSIPLDDALAIARTLMHERPLSHEAVAAMEAG